MFSYSQTPITRGSGTYDLRVHELTRYLQFASGLPPKKGGADVADKQVAFAFMREGREAFTFGAWGTKLAFQKHGTAWCSTVLGSSVPRYEVAVARCSRKKTESNARSGRWACLRVARALPLALVLRVLSAFHALGSSSP